MDISLLIKDLVTSGVKSFEGYGIKVSFHDHSLAKLPLVDFRGPVSLKKGAEADQDIQIHTQSVPPEDAGLAQTAEAEMNYDKVLNWSTEQSVGELETPLTGDAAPLTS
jgi:hypothetical protein